jgi:membrane-associated phospholipid phosphatase
MDIYLFRDYIGLFAPIILFILTLFLLRNMTTYLSYFVGGFLLNNILNVLLKFFIQEPRPTDDKKIIEIAIVNGHRFSVDKFGMPSGHAQNCGFCLSFVSLVYPNFYIISIYFLISFISLFQRYLYKNHTLLQLAIGLITGLIFGILTYLYAKKHVQGNVKMKSDENAPI